MAERHSEFERDENDWYVEPAWCVDRFFDRVKLQRPIIHDPCCGTGTIVDAAHRNGIDATGADLINRANCRFAVQNFLTDPRSRANIATNPPFKLAVEIVRHALTVVEPGGIVAAVAQAKFLFSQARHPLFNRPEMERVIVFSRRPSMPPGKMLAELGETCRGGGSMDYVWCVWRVGKTVPGCVVEWTL